MLLLIEPDAAYKDSFLHDLRAEVKPGSFLHDYLQKVEADFADFVATLRACGDKKRFNDPLVLERMRWYTGLDEYPDQGKVPEAYYWLITDGEYSGVLRLRPVLTEQLRYYGGNIGYWMRPSFRQKGYGKEILRLGLEKARAWGLNRVLLTCAATNIGSKKIIEANGGQLENAVEVEENGQLVTGLRYWIDLTG